VLFTPVLRLDAHITFANKVKGYKKNVARVGFLSLRHAHITALLEGGIPMDIVRQQAGHSTIGMTAHYYHASEKALKAATAALPDMGAAEQPSRRARTRQARNLTAFFPFWTPSPLNSLNGWRQRPARSWTGASERLTDGNSKGTIWACTR